MLLLKKAQFVEGRVNLICDAIHQVVQLAILRQILAEVVHELFDLRQILHRIGGQVEVFRLARDYVVDTLIRFSPGIGQFHDGIVVRTERNVLRVALSLQVHEVRDRCAVKKYANKRRSTFVMFRHFSPFFSNFTMIF